jgi:phage terminase large subunit-like protein
VSAIVQTDISIYDLAREIVDGSVTVDGFLDTLTDEDAGALLGEWDLWRLEHQIPPTWDFFIWLLYGGRGSGKTHCAAATMAEWAKDKDNFRGAYGLLGGKTYDDVAKYQIEGKSGIMQVAPADFRPRWFPGKQLLKWPNGVEFIVATGDKPESFHGPNVAKAWLDELARYKYPRKCWDDFILSVRDGANPQILVTTTPSTDPLIAELEDQALSDEFPEVVLTRGPTEGNPHLHEKSLKQFLRRYKGTRIGKEQLEGQVLRDLRGALVSLDTIARNRVRRYPHLDTIIVSIDPMGSDEEGNRGTERDPDEEREAGIVVLGRATINGEQHGFVLEDCSCGGPSHEWGRVAVAAFKRWRADLLIGEVNFGGDMVRGTIHAVDPRIPFQKVNASRGKRLRAEPVAALYEQDKVHHLDILERLENQWTKWVPGKSSWSPDRVDATVHGLTHLLLEDEDEDTDPWSAY